MVANSEQPVADSPVPAQRVSSVDAEALAKKYAEEKEKRQRPDGTAQYVELEETDKFASLARDPWVDHDALNSQPPALVDGQEVQVVILGAGHGGLLYAARLIEAGIPAEGIRLVDVAGGFGGTWYWYAMTTLAFALLNRFPGVMCDTEAYVYLPLLEETGFIPKHKYSYGEELRNHSERIAKHYGVADKAVFRTKITNAEWNDDTRRWALKLEQDRGPGHETVSFTAYSQFFIHCTGYLDHPKAPKIPGLEGFKGEIFHAARWNYQVTGGSPADQTLTRLEGKRVGILGTGSTSIQVTPKVAQFAKETYVFQRTPASVGPRSQKETDLDEWKATVATKTGWQLERTENFEKLCQGEEADDRYLNDGWSKLKTFAVITGRSDVPVLAKEDIKKHIDDYMQRDVPFQEAIRHRVDQIVHDPETAEALKPWYPSWCKRPGFHDEYLQTFNLPSVHLVDISSTKGVTGATPKGLAGGGQEVELDVIILGTGFRPPLNIRHPDPGAKSNTVIIGRNSLKMEDKWAANGGGTLHGLTTSSFPNFFLSGPNNAASGPNYTGMLETMARHTAYIVSEALRRAGDPGRAALEPSAEAEEAWVAEIVKYAAWGGPVAVCTPGLFNGDGDALLPASEEEQYRMLRNGVYVKGLPAYRRLLADWRADGRLEGIVLRG
ncbi:hypothetical protein VPNG_08162 [Cytospora leucostoma]|uniref:FAD/NAD(P)-binding domain-containing protein n=1 Tax=Cytospora leucostoma TaxID=1230097 RepID=A0A423WID6_9PEZI|nr:hypothetical protein VPNG_08162 [Cytospora leucostoma]